MTGANGFVGARVVGSLVQQGHQVVACVRSESGASYFSSATRVAVGDICSSTSWEGALEGVSTIIHSAAITSVADGSANSMAALKEVNIRGTLHLASRAAAMGVKRLVFLSSIKVNGEISPPGQPFRVEDASRPEGGYAQSKAAAEGGLAEIAAKSGLEVVIVRPPLVYGPGVKGNFAALASLVRLGLPLPLASATENRRSMIALDNLASVLALCATHPAAAGRIFLVKDGDDLSTVEVLSRIARGVGVPLRLFRVPPRVLRRGAALVGLERLIGRLFDDLQCDDFLIRTLLGWRPVVAADIAIPDACLRRSAV